MIVGIDLGTTNSAIGVWRDGRAELIPNSLGHLLTPSAVGIDEGGEVLVGLAARERQSTHPKDTATSFKRYMGSARITRLGKRDYLPEELSALVLGRLKADAEAYLGEKITEAVITVPAYFSDKQRKATRRAGELAGLKVERLLNEPTAAALAYGIHELENESRFMVFDLGGGTFDVSVLEIFAGVIEVRASTGDNALGGDDFNQVLMTAFRDRFAQELGAKARDDLVLGGRLREAAERARRALTDKSPVIMAVTWHDQTLEMEVDTERFEVLAEPLLARLRDPVLRSLRDSGLRGEELKEIILVGGSTRMPVVRRMVTRMFGRFPSNAVHPDEAVAIGAAIQAGLKARDAALSEVVMTDVCPYTLGVEVGEKDSKGAVRTGLFSPIIERNTVIPASRERNYFAMQDGQRVVEMGIYQGEARQVSDNIKLGVLKAKIPSARAGEVEVKVRFTYDINGLLEVDVHVPRTGERHQLVIVDDDAMTPEELERRRAELAKLKQHPREDDLNRQLLARANRCYETQLGDRRQFVANCILQFEGVLDHQDPREVEHARAAFTQQLDQIEGETWL
ncbi:MAG: molecular chaperone HscC [Caulobacteraceae bacterium]|nr:molecular chaperone HscC [Caulobacteraceae bacterium]